MTMDSTVDGKFEFLCNQILRTDSEFWEIRNKAVLGLTSLTLQYEGADTAKIQEVFNPNVFRMLKDPVKAVISDLRSQQIRDICMFLIKVSEITKDHMKSFLREAFNFILDGIKVPNRVMSGFVDNAILTMIKNTTFKSCIPSLLSEIQFSKAKLVREKCLEYLNEILIHWDVTEKDADLIAEAVKTGLEDAAVRGREIARMAYLNLHLLYPKKTEKIKANIPPALRARLIKEEVEKIGPILKAQEIAKASIQNKLDSTVKLDSKAAAEVEAEPEPGMLIITSPVKIANLRARRLSCEESAVASIQAIIRGRKCRRMTMSLHLNEETESRGSKSPKSPLGLDNKNFGRTPDCRESVCSPSLTTRAPFSAASPSKQSNCNEQFDRKVSRSSAIDNESDILGLLKVKAAMMLNHLNAQIALIENIENERKTPFEVCSVDSAHNILAENRDKFLKAVEKSLSISSNEVGVNEEFQRRMIRLLQ